MPFLQIDKLTFDFRLDPNIGTLFGNLSLRHTSPPAGRAGGGAELVLKSPRCTWGNGLRVSPEDHRRLPQLMRSATCFKAENKAEPVCPRCSVLVLPVRNPEAETWSWGCRKAGPPRRVPPQGPQKSVEAAPMVACPRRRVAGQVK